MAVATAGMRPNGAVFYRGPSQLNGDPILAVLTGLRHKSKNSKTGPMLQTWILRSDMTPMRAVETGGDDAICGRCPLRGSLEARTIHMKHTGQAPSLKFGRACYVPYWQAPLNVYKSNHDRAAIAPAELAAQLHGRFVRVGSYGDPAAVPFDVWDRALAPIDGWTGYTHSWRECDQRLRDLIMASVESDAGALEAQRLGWRTFRARQGDVTNPKDGLHANEVVCPASAEANHRLTCQQCGLCRGGASRSEKSIAILAHGRNAAQVPR